ncbi:MAG: Rne/Rng family ribonuclease [Alphaproteobacteria bacterium]|nr:Rne/Rng family ribonuclease [Alphaproteobacteria bacterium]
MTKRMLIDSTHAEETRVAVVEDNRLVDFDYESTVRKQLKGSIFLAKVTRVEPSLQAAFVNFGGNRHGFLPFSEIHPDYFRIPIADREALLAEQEAELEALEAAEKAEEEAEEAAVAAGKIAADDSEEDLEEPEEIGGEASASVPAQEEDVSETSDSQAVSEGDETEGESESDRDGNSDTEERQGGRRDNRRRGRSNYRGRSRNRRMPANSRRVEIVGGDELDGERPMRPSLRRNYKIQEVVKRGQIMLIQASKEERGNKGAAVTTYLSLPGRYCVLMPNSPRGGGVSRKIANYADRKRMREILAELNVPKGMSVIMRTAGVERTKTEIKRDLDYLMRLWDNIRDLTLQSTAPATVHEEGHLIRRSIRDIYARDVEEVLVAGEEGFKTARDFMKMMIPSHAKRVKLYEDERIPLFHRYQVESQISGMGAPFVPLKSGGSLVINPTEALVSVDVNSGRATRERHIEETALKTNLEAADEVARQLRLRDLGGLVVIDFIDMEDRRNNRKVEQRLKQALSTDRARIQIGRISSFGLMELSRQRLNPSLTEAQFQRCPHCEGIGYVRTLDSAAITALRALEEEGIRARAAEVALRISGDTALYILNHKRDMLADIERRYNFRILITIDETLAGGNMAIEVLKTLADMQAAEEEDESGEKTESPVSASAEEEAGERKSGRSSRRRGRRGGRRRAESGQTEADLAEAEEASVPAALPETAPETPEAEISEAVSADQETAKKPRRGRRSAAKKEAPQDSDDVAADQPVEKAEKPAVRKTAAKTKNAPPSNDTEPPAPKAYEKVNESPAQKKKGWWNRLVE